MASTNDPSAATEAEGEGEATLLVSEFPPPPFYYTEARSLKPPVIPREALERGTRKAALASASARARAEKQRLADQQTGEGSNVHDVLGGVLAVPESEEEKGDVVAVFGEVVEDPLLFRPLDPCEDPIVIRDEVKRLNREVVRGFINLLNDLVNRPAENKKRRDELQHNVFLMLEETNKFREHQSRELLIEILEKQNEERERLITELEDKIARADALLAEDPSNTIIPMDE